MKKADRTLALAGVVLALGLGTGKLAAQPGQGWPGIDPQQIQQRAKEFFRDKLVGGAGLIGGMRPGGNGGGPGGGGMDQIVRALLGIEPMPEAEALQKAIDNHASRAELKNALGKYVEARKRKQLELEKAQADLREVLTLNQEGTLVLMGLLD